MDCFRLQKRLKALTDLPDNLEFLHDDELDITEVGDGNLNDVIRISSKSDLSKSVILKYAPPFVKCLGPEYPLNTARNQLEFRALGKFHELCPGLVPHPLYCHQSECLLIMEDLVGYNDMRREVLKGVLEMGTIRDIADFTLKLHKNSHRKRLSSEAFTDMINDFKNDEMVDLTDQYFFTKPWKQDDPTNRSSEEVKGLHPLIYENKILLQNVNELREKFLNQQDCLLHGDLHTGSVMTKGQHAKIIDPEFAFIGPAGFDIGMLLANYLFSYHAHRCYPQEDAVAFHNTVKMVILETIEYYFYGMSAWLDNSECMSLIRETVGFAGCELIRRIIGTAHVLGFEDKPKAEVACIHLGIKLTTRYKEVTTTDAFITLLELD